MRKLLISLVLLLVIIVSIPPSFAVTVDGTNTAGEWNEAWAYCQDNVGTPVFPYGDRLEMEQDFTGVFYQEDPKNDSGPNNNESMAKFGESSGFDIKRFYIHYDPAVDAETVYGMATVYGIVGDLDGDGDVGTMCQAPPAGTGDCAGSVSPLGLTGISMTESFVISMTQAGKPQYQIVIIDNDWTTTNMDKADVNVAWTNVAGGVIEMSITNILTKGYFSTDPGSPEIVISVNAGGSQDIPGEDTARAYVCYPGLLGDRVWFDGFCDDKNNVQDPGEPGIAGVTVRLYEHGGVSPIATTTTNADGYYYFIVEQGCYDIEIVPPANRNAVDPNVGLDDTVDSDGINNRIENVCITPDNMVDLTNDFGFCRPPPEVPVLSLTGLIGLSGLLGIIAIFGIRMKR